MTSSTALRDQHLLAVPAGDNVIRLLPLLTVTDAEIHEALARIRAGAASMADRSAVAAK
jgi:acetylornithine/N-succinyldiaminopimelate aminotransferase